MKKFFTTTFACVLGVMIAGILLTLLSIAALTGMAVSTETEYTAKPNTIMKLDLGIVTDRSQEDFMSVLFGNQQRQTRTLPAYTSMLTALPSVLPLSTAYTGL